MFTPSVELFMRKAYQEYGQSVQELQYYTTVFVTEVIQKSSAKNHHMA